MKREFRIKHLYIHHTQSESLQDGVRLHCHLKHELLYFERGDIEYMIEGENYHPAPDSFLLIAPHVLHGVKVKNKGIYSRFAVHFSPELFDSALKERLLAPYSISRYFVCEPGLSVKENLELLMSCQGLGTAANAAAAVALQSLLLRISIACCPLAKQNDDICNNNPVKNIIQHLNENITSRHSLESLSAKFFISRHHLNKVFKKATGATIGAYIIHKRIALARLHMLNGASASKAAFEAGFNDYSVFFRAYKKITGYPPSVDLEKQRQQEL